MGYKKKIIFTILIMAIIFNLAKINLFAANTTSVGMWYSTWYAKEGKYNMIAGHGIGSEEQFLADVNGDGKQDAVVRFASGAWYVALSLGNEGFGGYNQWANNMGTGASKYMMGDVNGDGKEDVIVYTSDGVWYAATSNGSGFVNFSKWTTGHGVGSSAQIMGDVNGDGKKDAIVYFATGDWYVALSTGNGFSAYSKFTSGHGVGSSNQMVADVNGDGCDDAVVFFKNSGSWYTALSNKNAFGNYSLWMEGHGIGSNKQFLGDTNGDGKKDAIIYFGNATTSNWHVALVGTGNSFISPTLWKMMHGFGSNNQIIGNVFGTGIVAAIAYYKDEGKWTGLPGDSKYPQPNLYNTWESGFDGRTVLQYIPITNDVYNTYDSGDPAVIDAHLKMLTDAKVDYLIFDLTNNIYVDSGYIFKRAVAVAKRIQIWNNTPGNIPIKYAVGVGGMQFSHNPSTLENESKIVFDEFINQTYGGTQNYYYLDGKPLLVNYAEYNDRVAFEKNPISSYPNTSKTTLKWMQGINTGTSVSGQPPVEKQGEYYGWVYPNGSIKSANTMVVLPGHNNHQGSYISRKYNNVYGGFYSSLCWDRVDQMRPSTVIINSFNEYFEETAVAPTDTRNVSGTSEKWYNSNGVLDPNYYWNLTKDYIKKVKGY